MEKEYYVIQFGKRKHTYLCEGQRSYIKTDDIFSAIKYDSEKSAEYDLDIKDGGTIIKIKLTITL